MEQVGWEYTRTRDGRKAIRMDLESLHRAVNGLSLFGAASLTQVSKLRQQDNNINNVLLEEAVTQAHLPYDIDEFQNEDFVNYVVRASCGDRHVARKISQEENKSTRCRNPLVFGKIFDQEKKYDELCQREAEGRKKE